MENLSINKEIEYLSEIKIAIAKYEKIKENLETENKTFVSENQRLNTENRRLREENDRLDLFIKDKNKKLLELNEKILKAKVEFDKKNSQLYKELKEKEDKVASDKALNDLRLKEINKREQKLADKEEKINKQIQEKQKLLNLIKEQAKQNEIRNLENLDKEKQLNKKELELSERENRLIKKEEELENKLNILNKKENKLLIEQERNSQYLIEIKSIKEDNLRAIDIITKKNELLKEYLTKVAEKGCDKVKIEEILKEKIGTTETEVATEVETEKKVEQEQELSTEVEEEVETEVEQEELPIALGDLTYNELKEEAKKLGIEIKGNPKKDDLINSIKNNVNSR